MFKKYIKPAFYLFIFLTIITGAIYPLFVTVIAQTLFPHQANGSLIYREGKIVGSSLVGQVFDDPKYLWGRISATSPRYNASASSGSNIGPSNPVLLDEINGRIQELKAADPQNGDLIPVDLVTSSASGLDPHISLAAAYYQVNRIARVRGLSQDRVKSVIRQYTYGRFLGFLGEPVVNVLEVNIALDEIKK
ncbi:MAG: potassium-transporting ATPase subunit KdpC [Candidatus Omnitrophica bacterium]|nr:potassium-transporting ATPase subunit KdpC [Candidatus Omnitrophota bacterium]